MKQVAKKLLSVVFALCLAVVGIVTTPTVEASAEATASYVKVTSAPSDWSGTYLIVYEAENFAFNGALSSTKTLDASNNYITVTITDGKIAATDAMKDSAVTIAKSSDKDYTIQTASGYYIGNTSDGNKLASNKTTKYANTISLNGDGSVQITSSKSVLRFNTSQGDRFRYYKSSTYTDQKAIALYKLTEEGAAAPERNPDMQTAVNGIQSYMSLAFKYTATTIEKPAENKVVFKLGENGPVGTHGDGKDATTYTETVDGYTLNIADGVKMYTGAFAQGTGDSCIKLGTGSAVGGFAFTVPDDVLSVRISVAGYKANLATVTVNGQTTSVETTSDAGVFTDIIVDTTLTKDITLTTEKTPDERAMVNSITYVFAASENAGTVKETVYSDSEFRFRCGVDADVSELEGIVSYGIQVTVSGKSPVQYTSEAISWATEDNKSFVIISLGDIIKDLVKLGTKFTVQAYVTDANFTYVSESVKTLSVADMVEEYKAIPEVAHLYNYLVEKGLIEEVA